LIQQITESASGRRAHHTPLKCPEHSMFQTHKLKPTWRQGLLLLKVKMVRKIYNGGKSTKRDLSL